MSQTLNRTTKQLIDYANTPDYLETEWIINPDLSTVQSLPVKYWKIEGDNVLEMTQQEKDDVDNALLPAAKTDQTTRLIVDTRNYINGAYAPERQQTLSVLLADARTLTYSIETIQFIGIGLNDATSSGSFVGLYNLPKFEIMIDSIGIPDTFSVKDIVHDEITATNVVITGAEQDVAQGVKIAFAATTGHTLNDKFYIKVKRTTKINRTNYIAQALGWVLYCLNYHYTKLAEITNSTTLSQCKAITWDFNQFNATNPLVTIQDALAIPN